MDHIVCRAHLMNMTESTKKRILVTGANGYIGSYVIRALLDRGADAIAADRSAEFIDPRAKTVLCDIFDSRAELFSSREIPDAVLHLAWQDGFDHNSLSHMANLSAHFRFLTGLADRGVRQIAVMGSMHEIGYHEGAIDENTPCCPLSQYGAAKNALRQSMELFCRNRSLVFQWLRGFYLLGHDERNHSVFSRLLAAEAEGKTEFPFTSGTRQYDFLTVDELAVQIASSVLQDRVLGIIPCCSGRAQPIGEVAERFIREHGMKLRLRYGAYPDRAYDSPAIWGDDAKIRQILAMGIR